MKVLSMGQGLVPSRPSIMTVSFPWILLLAKPSCMNLKNVLKDCAGEPSGAIVVSRVGNVYIVSSGGK